MNLSELINQLLIPIHELSNSISQGDSLTKGLVTVSLLSFVVYIFRSVPSKIYIFISNRMIISIKAESNWYNDNRYLYIALGSFIAKNLKAKKYIIQNNEAIEGKNDIDYISNIEVIPDYNSGYFFYKGRPFFYRNDKSEEQGSVPASITLMTVATTYKSLLKFIGIDNELNSHRTKRSYYSQDGKEFVKQGDINGTLPLFLNDDVKKALDDKLNFFINNKEWYLSRNIPYKLLIVLYGEPGTGKSAIARYVSDRLNRSLGSITSGIYLEKIIRGSQGSNMVISIPDFDTLSLGKTRESKSDEDEKSSSSKVSEFLSDINTFGDSSLHMLLNLFQGDIPLNNSVVVMSTNYIENIDSALLRKGRTDLLLEIKELTYEAVNSFYQHQYDCTEELGDEYSSVSIKACDLVALFQENAFDKESFKKSLLNVM